MMPTEAIETQQTAKVPAMSKLKITAAQMVEMARARIVEVEVDQLKSMVDDPDVVIVDLRDVRERQRVGYIPGRQCQKKLT